MKTFEGPKVRPIDDILNDTQMVKELRVEIERLKRIAVEEVDEFNAGHAACQNGESIRDEPLGTKQDHWRIGYAFAAFDDLTAKLAAANAELHELRIKAASGQPEPDWSQAPEWARFWAIDDDGECYWFEDEPKLRATYGWSDSGTRSDKRLVYPGWESSLRQRPTPMVA